MKYKLAPALAVMSLLISNGLLAQTSVNDLPSWQTPKRFIMGLEHKSLGFADLEDSNGELALDQTALTLPLGKFDYWGQMVLPSIRLEASQLGFKNSDEQDLKLYSLEAKLTLVKHHSKQWSRILSLAPRISSDMEQTKQDDTAVTGLALWKYQASTASSWTFGTVVKVIFGEYEVIPVIAYQYQMDRDLSFKLGYIESKAEYRFKQNWSYFAAYTQQDSYWNYQNHDGQNTNLSYTGWQASTGVRYQLKDGFWATLEVGQALSRELEFEYKEDSQSDVDMDMDIEDSPMINFSIGLHI